MCALAHLWQAAATAELVEEEDAVPEHLGALVALDHEQRDSACVGEGAHLLVGGGIVWSSEGLAPTWWLVLDRDGLSDRSITGLLYRAFMYDDTVLPAGLLACLHTHPGCTPTG